MDNYQYPPTGDVLQMLLPLLSPTIVQIWLVLLGALTTLFQYRLMLDPWKMERLTVLLVSAVMVWQMSSVPLYQHRMLLMSPTSSYHLLLPMLYLPPPVPRLHDDLDQLVEAIALLSLTYNHTTFLSLHLHHLVNDRPMPPDQGQVQEMPSNNGRVQKKRS